MGSEFNTTNFTKVPIVREVLRQSILIENKDDIVPFICLPTLGVRWLHLLPYSLPKKKWLGSRHLEGQ